MRANEQVKITKTVVDALQKGETKFDKEIPGFHVRCLPSGVISYGYRYRLPDGRRPMLSLGRHGEITPDQARALAKKAAGKVADQKDPAGERDAERAQAEIDQTKTVNAILDQHVKHHVNGLRTAKTIISAFDRSVRPAIGAKLIYHPSRPDLVLTRDDIVDMLDDIAEENGESQADHTLAYLRKAFNWQMTRDSKFVSPIIKGMNRTNAHQRRGKRILTDEEIRDIWHAAESATRRNLAPAPGCFPQFIRLLFLTAQRRSQVARWHSDKMDHAGWMEQDRYMKQDAWIVPAGDYKNGETQLIPITEAIRKELVRDKGFMVSSDGGETAFGAFTKAKDAIDAELEQLRERDGRKPIPKWTFHDIRRTARSIMSRYTTPDIAERVIGHAITGVRGVYDHFDYMKEKREALEKLAIHVLGVVHPQPNKVVEFRALHG